MMAIPEGLARFIPPGQDEIQTFISAAANQSVRPYNTNEEYLYAMREDLAEWLKELYEVDIHVNNFIEFLDDGILLCEHANCVNDQANRFKEARVGDPILKKIILPSKRVRYTPGRHASTFFARDNVANFIEWCRKEMLIGEAVMFESNDLILRKNEKNFILCLLEMARRASKFGVPAPVLIQMEEDIDEEIEQDLRGERSQEQIDDAEEEEIVEVPVREPPKQKVACDFKSLDEMVQYILGMCTCPTQFPMVKVSEGKYKVGGSKTLIFMRILRNHVMVRVGGGWDTLEHYLDKHDPCRCNRHKVEQKIAARIRDLGLVLTPEEERQLINRAKRDSKNFKARNRSLSSQVGPRLSVKQANDIMDKAGAAAKTSKDWSHIRSQSLPAYEEKAVAPSSSRPSKLAAKIAVPVQRVTKSFENSQPPSSLQIEITTPRKSTVSRNTESPRPLPISKRDSKSNTLPRNHKTPEIRVTRSSIPDSLNQTYPVANRPTRASILRASKFDTSATGKIMTPRSDSLRSASTGSMSRDYRRSVTPTPTSTSQKRAQLSVARSKTPDPEKMAQSTIENRRTSRMRGPPSAYRTFETLPRDQRMNEKAPPRSDARLSTANRSSSVPDRKYNSLPRPSSALAYRSPSEKEPERRSNLSVSKGLSYHGSMPDVRQPPRPKSALGNPTLSTVPRSNTVRKTIATTAHNPTMQRLTARARSQSMDNLSIQKQLNSSTAEIQRNQFFDRLSQPKSSATRRSRTNLLDENVLFVQRKGEGRHSVQRNASTPRSEAHDPDNRITSESSPKNTVSTGNKGSLRLSVNMSGMPDSPNSKVSYSWGDDASANEPNMQPHTPKIIHRQHQPDSHLKAPPKEKVSKEEVLYVVRNNDGRHQWEHTMTSLEKSQEYTDLSPYKQFSPRSSTSDKPRTSSIRNASSSSESSVMSPVGKVRPSMTGMPSPGFNQEDQSRDDRNVKSKYSVGSLSTSSVASSKSSGETRRKKPNISEQVRSMLFTEDGKVKPPSNSTRTSTNVTSSPRPASSTPRPSSATPRQFSSTPRQSSTTPRPSSTRPRPSTPRRDLTGQSRTQARPLTPKASTTNRLSTVKPRSKTPDPRRNTLTRQEKLKSFDGPSSKNEANRGESLDKESRMLMEFEKEYLENQRLMSQSGDESGSVDQQSVDNDGQYWEYDYNGRRVRQNRARSKPTSSLKSKSTPRMERMSSYDSELTDHSFDCGTSSIANSEDFEVAMAMSNGMKQQNRNSSSIRSRSVDNFLDERVPRPRKDKHDSRKSRIPTPVHFNSGRKSATGILSHDSNPSKSALRSNVEGVSSLEIDTMNRRGERTASRSNTSNTGKHSQYQTSKKQIDPREEPHPGPSYHHKENIRPSRSQRLSAEEYSIDNFECFTFGRHADRKAKPPGSTNLFVNKNAENNFARSANSNDNNNVSFEQGAEESPEPIPPRKKSGYYRSQLHSSPADLLQVNRPTGQVNAHVKQASPQNSPQHTTASKKQERSSRPIHDRNDSGFDPGSDPNSPLSPYPDTQMGGRHSKTRSSAENAKGIDQSDPVPASPGHGVLDTPSGKYYFVMPGQHNTRLHTGYDAPRQNQVTSGSYVQEDPKKMSRNPSTNDSAIVMATTPHQSQNRSFSTGGQYPSPTFISKPGQTYRLSNDQPHNYRSGLAASSYSKNPSQTSSDYGTINGSLGTVDPRAQFQSQPEQKRRDSLQGGTSDNDGSIPGKSSKRMQFKEFFNDNQKLKETLNRLDQFYQDHNTTGSGFQYEDLPEDDRQGPSPTRYSHGNPFSFDTTDGNEYPITEDARQPHEISSDASGREYPNMNPRSSSNDTPARPSQYKAFEKHRFDPKVGQYKEIHNNADQRFPFADGFQKSACKEEYV